MQGYGIREIASSRARLIASSLSSPCPTRPAAPILRIHIARSYQKERSDDEAAGSNTATQSQDGTSSTGAEEARKLLEARRDQQEAPASSTNLLQGALEQAQLITWPKPQKAFLDTFLVLAIVILTGTLLLGLNIVFANASEFWYHRS